MKETLERLNIEFDTLEPFRDGMWLLHGSGKAMRQAWFTLNGVREETGFSPILLGDFERLMEVLSELQNPLTPQALLERAGTLNGQTLLQQRLEGFLADYLNPEEDEPLHDELEAVDWDDLRQDAQALSLDFFWSLWDPQRADFHAQAHLLLLPDPDESHAHALLRYSHFHDYPEAAEQVAILSHWKQQYGARLAAFGPDSLELWLERPLSDPHTAFALAQEHFAYTPDAVLQGAGTMQALAQSLMHSNTWYFWWD